MALLDSRVQDEDEAADAGPPERGDLLALLGQDAFNGPLQKLKVGEPVPTQVPAAVNRSSVADSAIRINRAALSGKYR